MVAEKSKIKTSVDSVFGKDSVPGLQMTVFLFCPYIGFLGACTWGWRKRDLLSLPLFIRALIS